MFRNLLSAAIFFGITSPVSALDSSIGKLTVAPMVEGLEQPWGFARGQRVDYRTGWGPLAL